MCMYVVVSLLLYCMVCLSFPHNQQRSLQTVVLELITETIPEPPRLTLPPTKIHRLSILFRFTDIFARSFHVPIQRNILRNGPSVMEMYFHGKSSVGRHHVINIPRVFSTPHYSWKADRARPSKLQTSPWPRIPPSPLLYFRFTALIGAFKQTSCLYLRHHEVEIIYPAWMHLYVMIYFFDTTCTGIYHAFLSHQAEPTGRVTTCDYRFVDTLSEQQLERKKPSYVIPSQLVVVPATMGLGKQANISD